MSNQPRAARQRSGTILASPLSTTLAENLGPGGSAYFEYRIPADHTNVYRIDVDVAAYGDVADVSAMVVAFGSYPLRCAADRVLTFGQPTADPYGNLHYHGQSELLLPDSCGSITVIVTHGAPRSSTEATANVAVSMVPPFDSFQRVSGPLDWGLPSSSVLAWVNPAGAPVAGSVSSPDGRGRLNAGASAMHGDPALPTQGINLIGQLDVCTDPKATFSIGTQFATRMGGSLSLAGDGTLILRTDAGSTTAQTSVDPCSPWYLTLGLGGSGVAVKLWQVTAAEPVTLTLDAPSQLGLGGRLILTTLGTGLIIDVLDIDWQTTG